VVDLDRNALDALSELRSRTYGYTVRSRFGWSHKLTIREAPDAFPRPIDGIVQELEAEDQASART
jgi:hypothetical protein